ncbi:MAG: hemin uptake protein HemP [Planctomycetales bacterium]|nr:hemin uptake protein HemP [Planctomycetales bacterium]
MPIHVDEHDGDDDQQKDDRLDDVPHAAGGLGESESSTRIVDSATILAGKSEVWIRHGREMYRLRLTSSGRLYLSK